jgi:HK97 family phage portal protein
MGLFDFFKSRKNIEPTIKDLAQEVIDQLEVDDVKSLTAFDPIVGGANSISSENISLTKQDAQRLYISDIWIYSAINAIASTVSSIPLVTKVKKVTQGKVSYEINTETELQALISYPNPYCSITELLALIAIDLNSTGEAFLYLDGIGRGSMYKMPKAIYRLNPAMIETVESDKGPFVDHYKLVSEYGEVRYSPKEICHIRLPNPFSNLQGLSPLVAAFQNIKLDRMITEHEVNFYQKGARLGGVLTHTKALTKQQLSAIQRSFESNYTGHRNTHRTLVLPSGMEYKVISGSSSDSQTLEKAKYNRDAIISALKVPPIKLGFLEQASYSNAEVQEKFYYSDTILPLLTLIQNSLNLHGFITPPDYSILLEFDTSNITALREDYNMLAETAERMIKAGLTIDEVREMIWKKEALNLPTTMVPYTAAEIAALEAKRNPQPPTPSEDVQHEVDMQPEEKSLATKELPSGDMPHISQDVIDSQATFQDRVAQLTSAFITQGVPPADAARGAVEQAMQEYGLPGATTQPQTEPTPAPENIGGTTPALTKEEVKKPETPKQEHCHKVTIGELVCTTSMSEPGPEHTHILFYKDRNIESSKPIATPDGHKHTYDLPDTESDASTQEHMNNEGKDVKVERQPGESLDDCVSRAIPKLLDEGYSRDQAVAMAYSMCELPKNQDESKDITPEVSDPWTNIAQSKKEAMLTVYKNFQDKTEKLVTEREKELGEFFAGYKEIIVKGVKREAKRLDKAWKTKANDDDVRKILNLKELDAYVAAWIAKHHPSLAESIKQGYDNTLPGITIDFTLTDPIVEALMKEIELDQVKLYDETTRKQLATVLSEQFANGATITEIGRAISRKFDQISAGRAQTIARTEVLSAYSEAEELRQDEIEKSFPDQKIKRTWITMLDEFVRDGSSHPANHVKLHGVEKLRGKAFDDGLSKLEYPRDPSGAAGSVINCRCTLLKELVGKE